MSNKKKDKSACKFENLVLLYFLGGGGFGGGGGGGNWDCSDSFRDLRSVDYGSVSNFVQIVKNFYQECEAVQNRSEEEVMKWRSDNEVYVQDRVSPFSADVEIERKFSNRAGLGNLAQKIGPLATWSDCRPLLPE